MLMVVLTERMAQPRQQRDALEAALRASSCANVSRPFSGNGVSRSRSASQRHRLQVIDSRFDAAELAEFLLASWEGAILRMKVERGLAALERFKKIMFETVFKEQK